MYTEIYLGKEVLKENELGEKERTLEYSDTSLFCFEKSVRNSEYYQAMQTGLKAEKIVSMNIYEYYEYMKNAIKRVCKVRHSITNELIEYTIIREYENGNDAIELTLQRGVENVST
jgi:hypothetical protein|nr:MAG TPA: hypothetical protein [Caudoviricetes sp.]